MLDYVCVINFLLLLLLLLLLIIIIIIVIIENCMITNCSETSV